MEETHKSFQTRSISIFGKNFQEKGCHPTPETRFERKSGEEDGKLKETNVRANIVSASSFVKGTGKEVAA